MEDDRLLDELNLEAMRDLDGTLLLPRKAKLAIYQQQQQKERPEKRTERENVRENNSLKKENRKRKPKKQVKPKSTKRTNKKTEICFCENPDLDNNVLIGCDSCNKWYHISCLQMSEETANNISQFVCKVCEEEQKPTARVPAPKKEKKKCALIGCKKNARVNSKYCHEECGLEVTRQIIIHHELLNKKVNELKMRNKAIEILQLFALAYSKNNILLPPPIQINDTDIGGDVDVDVVMKSEIHEDNDKNESNSGSKIENEVNTNNLDTTTTATNNNSNSNDEGISNDHNGDSKSNDGIEIDMENKVNLKESNDAPLTSSLTKIVWNIGDCKVEDEYNANDPNNSSSSSFKPLDVIEEDDDDNKNNNNTRSNHEHYTSSNNTSILSTQNANINILNTSSLSLNAISLNNSDNNNNNNNNEVNSSSTTGECISDSEKEKILKTVKYAEKDVIEAKLQTFSLSKNDIDQYRYFINEIIATQQRITTAEEMIHRIKTVDSVQLENQIQFANSTIYTPSPNDDINDEKDEKTSYLECPSCGMSTNAKKYFLHVEPCYIKRASSDKYMNPRIYIDEPHTLMLCNYYDPKERNYCHRLYSSCPLHRSHIPKKEIIRENQICGCPLSGVTLSSDNPQSYCSMLKTKCKKHLNWEKLKRTDLLQQLKIQEVGKHWQEQELHLLHCSVVSHYKSSKLRPKYSVLTHHPS